MLGVKSRVPVDLGIIESESAVFFVDFYVHVVFACEEFVAESAVFVLFADFVGFVDYGSHYVVFVHEHFGDEMLVR